MDIEGKYRDDNEHTVYPLQFQSSTIHAGDKERMNRPGLTIGTTREDIQPWFQREVEEAEVIKFPEPENKVLDMPSVASYPDFMTGVADLKARRHKGDISQASHDKLYTDLIHRFMKKESFETPWFLREASSMATKIRTNKTQQGGQFKSGDVFLNLLAKNPDAIIDKKTKKPTTFPDAKQLLQLASQYKKKYKKSITTDPNVWQKALVDLNFTNTVLDRIEKTSDFGASEKEKFAKQIQPAAIFKGADISDEEVKSIDVAIANNSINGKQLADTVIKSPTLNNKNNELGQIVINIAKNLKQGSNKLPEGDWLNNNSAVKSIQDYAGEYLGVIGLIHNVANFPNKPAFFNYMGANALSDLNYYFPSKTNTPLADSFGSISNDEGTSVMNISSKGGTQGAAPSLANLKSSPGTRKKKEFQEEIQFIDAVLGASEFEGAFRLFNVLYDLGSNARKGLEIASKGIPIKKFSENQISDLNAIYKNRKKTTPKKEIQDIKAAGFVEYLKSLEKINPKTPVKNPIGYLFYFTQKIVIEAVNQHNALPEFQACVREVLGDNFMQILTKIQKGKIDMKVLYPAQINGRVTLATGSGQATFAGKLGFRILPTKGYFK